MSLGHELLERSQQDGDVVGVEADRRLVEEIQDLFALLVDEVVGQLDPLELAAGESGRRLAELEVAEADLDEGIELLRDLRPAGEKEAGFGDAQAEDLVDILAVPADVEDLLFEALALAGVADEADVRKELHLDDLDPGPLAVFAAAAGRVERKETGPESHELGLAGIAEQGADAVHSLGVGGRDGARRRAEGRLVDHDDLGDLVPAP